MSYILESIKKSSKTDWHGEMEINPSVNSSVKEKDRIESGDKIREISSRNEKKQNNSSVREQIFHPVDRIF